MMNRVVPERNDKARLVPIGVSPQINVSDGNIKDIRLIAAIRIRERKEYLTTNGANFALYGATEFFVCPLTAVLGPELDKGRAMFNEPYGSATTGDYPGAAILPAQYFGKAKGRKRFEGEYRLLLAVLAQAVRSYLASMRGRTAQQRLDFEELRRWFYAPLSTARQELFAFESICDQMEIDAGMLRKRLGSISIRDLPTLRQPRYHSRAPRQHRAQRQRTAALESAA